MPLQVKLRLLVVDQGLKLAEHLLEDCILGSLHLNGRVKGHVANTVFDQTELLAPLLKTANFAVVALVVVFQSNRGSTLVCVVLKSINKFGVFRCGILKRMVDDVSGGVHFTTGHTGRANT